MGSRDTQRGINATKQLQEQGLDVEPITIEYAMFYSLFSCIYTVATKCVVFYNASTTKMQLRCVKYQMKMVSKASISKAIYCLSLVFEMQYPRDLHVYLYVILILST